MKRKFPLPEVFIILFGLLLLNGSMDLFSFNDIRPISWFDSKFSEKPVFEINTADDFHKLDIKPGMKIAVDTNIVSTYYRDDAFNILGLAELGERVKTTLKLTTPSGDDFVALSQSFYTTRLELEVSSLIIEEKTENLALFDEDYVPASYTEITIRGEITSYSLL